MMFIKNKRLINLKKCIVEIYEFINKKKKKRKINLKK